MQLLGYCVRVLARLESRWDWIASVDTTNPHLNDTGHD